MSRKALVIAYRFPPQGGVGSHRTSYFVRYLENFGWQPHVLTAREGAFHLQDTSLMALIPSGVSITRTPYFDPSGLMGMLGKVRLGPVARLFTLPQMDVNWVLPAYQAGMRLVKQENFAVLYSSGLPMCSHLAAYWLHRRTGLPWVADYRDEWSLNEVYRWPSSFHRRLAARLDGMVMRAAKRVITTSPACTDAFMQGWPVQDSRHYLTITNGFDEADFPANGSQPFQKNRALTITYVGALYREQTADTLIAAVRELLTEGKIPAEDLNLVFVGNTRGYLEFPDLVEKGVLKEVGYLNHDEAVGYMQKADALLLLLSPARSLTVSSKTFEYMAARRPILALAPLGPTASIIEETRSGIIVDPVNIGQIKEAILDFYGRWKAGTLQLTADQTAVERYTRRETTRALAAVFDEIAN